MKIYRTIVIILSVITGIAATVLLILSSPVIMPSFTGSITSESYQVLEDYAFEIASNSDTEPMDGIVVTKNLTRESLIVDVDASIYGVEAIFPISNYEEKIENGIIKYEGIIDYNNVTYSEHTDVYPPWFYIFICIIFVVVIAFILYTVFYGTPSFIIFIIKALTKKH